MARSVCVTIGLVLACALAAQSADAPADDGFVALFPADGVPEGWKVTSWSDVAKAPPPGAAWRVAEGVLHGSRPRGSAADYGQSQARRELTQPTAGRSWRSGAGTSQCRASRAKRSSGRGRSWQPPK